MRQRDDKKFAELLTHLGDGEINDEEIKILENRKNVSHPKHQIIHLCKKNSDVDSYNDYVLLPLPPQEIITITAVDKCVDNTISAKEKEYWLDSAKKLTIDKTDGLPYILKLSLNVRYIITNNLKVTDGLVNGAIGILKQIDYDKNKVIRVWLQFEDDSTGSETRSEINYYYKENNIPSNWVPINYMRRTIQIGKKKTSTVLRRMLPLRIAEALTIHKSQGSTYTENVVHKPHTLSRRELYVACSRVTSLSGLYFENFDGNLNKTRINCDDTCKQIIKKAEKEKPLKFDLLFLQDYEQYETFIFANIQSLHKHFNCVKGDKCFVSSTFIFLVETWTLRTDEYTIPNYRCLYRHDCNGIRRFPYGICIYAKEHCKMNDLVFESNYYDRSSQIAHNIVAFTYNNYCFCVVYRSPSENLSSFKNTYHQMINTLKSKLLPNTKIIIVGDFNVDLQEDSGKSFLSMFKSDNLDFQLKIGYPSTNKNTQIDLCFSNYSDLNCRYYENYFGYHKPITCILNMPAVQPEAQCTEIIQEVQNDGRNELIKCNSIINKETQSAKNISKRKHSSINVIQNLKNSEKSNSSIINSDRTFSSIENVQSDNTLENAIFSKNKTQIYKKPRLSENSNLNIPRFLNIDGVSCYANAVVQCLLNSQIFMATLKTQHDEIMLTRIMLNFIRTKNQQTTSYLRQFIGNPFILKQQQDVHEFIITLIGKSKTLEELTKNVVAIEYTCENCDVSDFQPQVMNFVPLDLVQYFDKNSGIVNIDTIFNSFMERKLVPDLTCSICNACKIEQYEFISSGDLLILYFNTFEFDNETQMYKKIENIENIKITNVPSSLINICSKTYKFSSAIFHVGNSIQSGHYVSIINTQFGFFECNDHEITAYNWPEDSKYLFGKNISTSLYVMIYEKVD